MKWLKFFSGITNLLVSLMMAFRTSQVFREEYGNISLVIGYAIVSIGFLLFSIDDFFKIFSKKMNIWICIIVFSVFIFIGVSEIMLRK
jgi:hypothetical protein